eukprot:CAMPEP_0202475370 /NCGR_PEP_ID=MMETSP1360-20130828/92866_1 /ASSEMBLY_ACC=CAM_ASM_000848 /TAXON_ID=515479 /ORGANISM="Licmophora paradoxa, Strain CCMP2313" /LENGTH=104 /DNA_ID=CAMNT_0049102527 /DNA_START=183 /DNA_END=499 /DNA_ORIENTATION=-
MKSCIEAITQLRYKLRMFGIPLNGFPTYVFCDNESVVSDTSKVESTLNKKHNPLNGFPTYVFCDNESVVSDTSKVESTLNKKHNSIAYHYDGRIQQQKSYKCHG